MKNYNFSAHWRLVKIIEKDKYLTAIVYLILVEQNDVGLITVDLIHVQRFRVKEGLSCGLVF